MTHHYVCVSYVSEGQTARLTKHLRRLTTSIRSTDEERSRRVISRVGRRRRCVLEPGGERGALGSVQGLRKFEDVRRLLQDEDVELHDAGHDGHLHVHG